MGEESRRRHRRRDEMRGGEGSWTNGKMEDGRKGGRGGIEGAMETKE